MKALVLVKAPAKFQWDIADRASLLKGVTQAYPVFGRFDVVVLLKGRNLRVLEAAARRVKALKGIKSTETLLESA